MAWNDFDRNSTVASIDATIEDRIRKDEQKSSASRTMSELHRKDLKLHRPTDSVGSACTACNQTWPCNVLKDIAFGLD